MLVEGYTTNAQFDLIFFHPCLTEREEAKLNGLKSILKAHLDLTSSLNEILLSNRDRELGFLTENIGQPC